MKKLLSWSVVVGLALCSANALAQETFSNYVSTCKQQLGFTDAEVAAIASKLDCTKGILFAPNATNGGAVNDFVGYARVNDLVDLTFACRWLDARTRDFPTLDPFVDGPFIQAASVELMMHNRQSGNTCYFQAREQPIAGPREGGRTQPGVPVVLVSPTVAAAAAPGTPAANFWNSPTELSTKLPCADCHVAGPYIASPRIAPALAQFGLLNNGHDTYGLQVDPNNNTQLIGRYHAVGSTFGAYFNNLIASYNAQSGCTSCHTIALNSPTDSVFHNRINSDVDGVLLPSIRSVIDSVIPAGVMPADSLFNSLYSDYRWVNMDTPTNDSNTAAYGAGDYETLVGLEQRYPLFYCTTPLSVSAHAVGTNAWFSTNDLPDKLHFSNMRDGLECLNADQPAGRQCHDYRTRYFCNGAWSGWFNTDSPSNSGDIEDRSRDTGLCAAPTAMQTAYNAGSTTSPEWIAFNVSNDRLAEFDVKGLICKNSDQGTGNTCQNYVVQFTCSSHTSLPDPTPLGLNQNSGSIGTAEKTFVVTNNIAGWSATSATGRKIYVNGVPVTSGQALPPKTMDGKYYFTFTAGGVASAAWSYH